MAYDCLYTFILITHCLVLKVLIMLWKYHTRIGAKYVFDTDTWTILECRGFPTLKWVCVLISFQSNFSMILTLFLVHIGMEWRVIENLRLF
jgi:hypothetical protein